MAGSQYALPALETDKTAPSTSCFHSASTLPHFHTTSTPVGAMGIFFQRTHLTRETQNSKRTWLENDEDDDKRTMIDENKDYDCEVSNDDPK